MVKIPSSKFSTVKKKIVSAKFPKTKRKLSSEQPAHQTAKIPSRKLARAKQATNKVVDEPAPLGRPSDESARHEALATLKSRTEALKTKGEQKTAR